MATMYEISVFGQDIENVESDGGWQMVFRTTSYDEAETKLAELLEELGWDNVMWDWDSDVASIYEPDYEPADIDSDFGFDPYEGCYTYDC